ncbi:RNase HII [Natranaerovirga pectinivora]|uniref:Ribonuclease HII n=1 Tax=Natranaerovirga pectinivora TaxID=682400 RepID=A0A4R3MR37_9FIRM|nr:ribonuclease HII [Natranaerovirga pectinivora]TCT16983.1 RNase HII [Natranaerovirga pectinivora]
MSSYSISDIKSILERTTFEDINHVINDFRIDERVGVKKLIAQYEKKLQSYYDEINRIEDMKVYERKYYEQYNYICGIDEVGRGPLAGPVVSGAVVLKKDVNILYLNDSKKLSEKKREELYDEIIDKAECYSVGVASVSTIDEINILQSTYESMRNAISGLDVTPEVLLVDAVTIPGVEMPQEGIVKGDAKSVSIAAASIIAKVTRDRMMEEYDKIYPEYGFKRNKGYGTEEHVKALKEFGPCPIHRISFIRNLVD